MVRVVYKLLFDTDMDYRSVHLVRDLLVLLRMNATTNEWKISYVVILAFACHRTQEGGIAGTTSGNQCIRHPGQLLSASLPAWILCSACAAFSHSVALVRRQYRPT